MKELFVTPHLLLFRADGKSRYIPLEEQIDISVRSLTERERVFFRGQRVMDLAIKQHILVGGSYTCNTEEQAKELGFYLFCLATGEQIGAISYDKVVQPYARVVQLESKIADEVKRDEYVCDVRREIALLKMLGVYLELYAVPDEKSLFDGVRLYLSNDYDLKVNVAVGERLVN